MENRAVTGREFLESMEEGLYARRVHEVMQADGVIHLAPDCMFLGVPCYDDPKTIYCVFACAHLPSLFRMLCGLRGYERIRWVRGFKGSLMVRERNIQEYARHLGLAENISKL